MPSVKARVMAIKAVTLTSTILTLSSMLMESTGSTPRARPALLTKMSIEKGMVAGRPARSGKSGPGAPEVVNEKFNKELNREMNAFR